MKSVLCDKNNQYTSCLPKIQNSGQSDQILPIMPNSCQKVPNYYQKIQFLKEKKYIFYKVSYNSTKKYTTLAKKYTIPAKNYSAFTKGPHSCQATHKFHQIIIKCWQKQTIFTRYAQLLSRNAQFPKINIFCKKKHRTPATKYQVFEKKILNFKKTSQFLPENTQLLSNNSQFLS